VGFIGWEENHATTIEIRRRKRHEKGDLLTNEPDRKEGFCRLTNMNLWKAYGRAALSPSIFKLLPTVDSAQTSCLSSPPSIHEMNKALCSIGPIKGAGPRWSFWPFLAAFLAQP